MNKFQKKLSLIKTGFVVALSSTVMLLSGVAEAAAGKSVILLQPTEECTYCADYIRFFKDEADKAGLSYEITTAHLTPLTRLTRLNRPLLNARMPSSSGRLMPTRWYLQCVKLKRQAFH